MEASLPLDGTFFYNNSTTLDKGELEYYGLECDNPLSFAGKLYYIYISN